MDKNSLLEIEKKVKEYDPTYETKIVKPGSVIEVFIDDENNQKGVFYYVCKEGEKEAPENSGISSCIMYNGYEKYFKDAIVDDQIEVGNTIFSINEIYNTVDEFINRFDMNNLVDVDAVVDVTQDGHNFIYYIVNPDDNIKIQDGLCVINTNAPVFTNMKGKKAGDIISFDVLNNDNNIIINHVYASINDYNIKNNINVVKEGSVVDVTIDNISFILYMSDEQIDTNEYETINTNTSLYKNLIGKTTNNSFIYTYKDKNMKGYINNVYSSLEEYLNLEQENEKIIG